MLMKILWLCNTPLPEVQNMFGIRNYNESWLSGISGQLRMREDIELHYVFPQKKYKRTIKKVVNGITFWGFYNMHKNSYEVNIKNNCVFISLINNIDPDIIHIFGTEYSHSLEFSNCVKSKEKIIVSIQGLTSEIAKVYLQGIPKKYCLSGMLVNQSHSFLLKDQIMFYKRGVNEKKLLLETINVIGRTNWDKKVVASINPSCQYFHCNETLRDVFYSGTWNIENIQRHSIFISQAYYPIKGFHIVVCFLTEIIKKFPDTMVYVAGNKSFLNDSPYGLFIKKLIKEFNVKKHINFLGILTADKIKEQLLKSHVMIMPSLIENSPNSIGEAMMLGVPVVAADVGGISSIIDDKKEGYLYSALNGHELMKAIYRIFSNDNIALYFSHEGQKRAKNQYDKLCNEKKLLEIYDQVINCTR